MTRANMVNSLIRKGRNYKFKRFSTKQIFAMYQKYVLNR
jgi:hypothetical protein